MRSLDGVHTYIVGYVLTVGCRHVKVEACGMDMLRQQCAPGRPVVRTIEAGILGSLEPGA